MRKRTSCGATGRVILLALLTALVACAPTEDEDWDATPPPCEDGTLDDCAVETLEHDGDERSYVVTGRDACGSEPRPLILVWHGSGVNAEYVRARIHPRTVGEEDAVVVFPFGLSRPELDGRTGWNRDPDGNDVAFFDALVDELAATTCADPARVFSLGHSRGGRFVDVLGCVRGDEHRAMASISGGTGNVTSCDDQMPMWITHGRRDEYVPFWEGEDYRNRWAAQNGCDVPGWFDGFPDDTCTELPGCAASTPVVWCPHTSQHEAGHGPLPWMEDAIEDFFGRF